MRGWAGILILIVFSAEASMESHYQEGRAFTESLHHQSKNVAAQTDVKKVPGFKTAEPKEASLDENSDFQEAIHQALEKNQAASGVIENSKKRPRFKIDPKTDPRFQVDLESSEERLGIDPTHTQKKVEGSFEKTCEEGGEEITYTCQDNRVVIPQVPMKSSTLWVNNLNFEKHMESYETKPAKKGKWNRHGRPAEYGSRQNGWDVQLPKDITAFRASFCSNFQAKDAKSRTAFQIDCTRIQRYEIKEAHHVGESNEAWQVHVPEAFLKLILHHDTYEGEARDEWHSNCEPLEKMVHEGYCDYVDRTLSQGPEKRTIQGYSIYKDDWQYTQVYDCQLIKDECTALRSQGCHQVGSLCKEMREGRCWMYEQRYQCPSGNQGPNKIKSPSHAAFCLTGDCHSTDYTANGEMLEAISRLNALKEIQDDMRTHQGHLNIFKGEMNQCSRHCLNFKDCCRRLKGWGVSLGLANCEPEDRALAEKRAKNLCHPVGTYCAEFIEIGPLKFKKCKRKKSSFCCFGTRLARLLQEQGRQQLGLGFGSAECPDCRGLTVEELSRLDLSKMNFSEVFEDVMKKYRTPNQDMLQQKASSALQERLKEMEQGLEKRSKTGKVHVHQDAL